MNQVCIIIPVYNAFQQAQNCLESVLKHSPADISVFVVDDCSNQGTFAEYLANSIRADSRLRILRNQHNLGFVRSCNLGMLELAGAHDVILLNSDTVVSAGWVEKLQHAALSRPDVATVTPLTNNGTICSVPRFCCDNELPRGFSVDEFAALVEEVSMKEYPTLPTCVGFCTYIRREALERLGGFDAQAFGAGYGEENDFSLRAQQAGMVDILDDATFIFHLGNCSFGEAQKELSARNSALIRKRHPTYFDDVGRFCREAPLYDIHSRIHYGIIRRWTATSRLNMLHILHNGPFAERHHPLGGTELHVQDIIKNTSQFTHWSLVPTESCYYLTAHLPGFDREFILNRKSVWLLHLLKRDFFDLIHLHHAKGFNFGELDDALRAHGNYVVALHDFYNICPRVNMLTPTRKHCSGHECTSACSFGAEYISEYRRIAAELLAGANEVIFFSQSTQDYFKRILKREFSSRIEPHGIFGGEDQDNRSTRVQVSREAPSHVRALKVGFLGFVPQHKGSLIIEKLLRQRILPSGIPVEWHVIGTLFLQLPEHVVNHGTYSRDSLAGLLSKVDLDLSLILSICPETYCLTLDEGWNAGIPAVVTPLGAPAERVERSGAGWVLPSLTPQAVLEKLDYVATHWDEYTARRRKIAAIELISLGGEMLSYEKFYCEHTPWSRARIESLIHFLEPAALKAPPIIRFHRKIMRYGLNHSIRLLERTQLRPVVEKLFYRVAPRRMVQNFKDIRTGLP